jgi:hypothetical protein
MTDGASEAEFGVLDDFFERATTRIGYPNPGYGKSTAQETTHFTILKPQTTK